MGMPLFDQSGEMLTIVKELVSKRNDIFHYVQPEMITCAVRFDKDQPESQSYVLKIEGVRGSKTVLNPDIKYIIWGYKSTWNRLSQVEKYAHLTNMLIRIKYPTEDDIAKLTEKGEDFEWGKLTKPDIVDSKSFLKAFGIEWVEVGSGLPNVLDETEISVL